MGGKTHLRYRAGEEEYRVEVERSKNRMLKLRLNGREVAAEVLSVGGGWIQARLDGRYVVGRFAIEGSDVLISVEGDSCRLSRPASPDVDDMGLDGVAAGGASLTAPMPGTVVKVLVDEGEEVEEGERILVLEAMKTEHSVTAPHDGVVSSIPYGEGDTVSGGAVLVELEEV